MSNQCLFKSQTARRGYQSGTVCLVMNPSGVIFSGIKFFKEMITLIFRMKAYFIKAL